MEKAFYLLFIFISFSCNKQPNIKSKSSSVDSSTQNDSSAIVSEKVNLKNYKILQSSDFDLKEISLIMLNPNFNSDLKKHYKYLVEIKTLYSSEGLQFSSDDKMKKLDDFENILTQQLLKANLDIKYVFRIRQAGISYYYLATNDSITVKEKLGENINKNFVHISIQKKWNIYDSALEKVSKK